MQEEPTCIQNNTWSNYFDGVGISKIGFTKDTQFEVKESFLDLNERKIFVPLEFYRKHFAEFTIAAGVNSPIFAFGEDKKRYSLHQMVRKEFKGNFFVVTVDKIVKGPYYVDTDIELEHITECTFEMNYQNGCKLNKLIESFKINYDSYTVIELTNNGIQKQGLNVTLKMISENPEILITDMYHILEMLFLYLGVMPESIITSIKYHGRDYTIYDIQMRKYRYRPPLSKNTAFQKVSKETFKTFYLKKFIRFRESKDVRFLFDKFLDACNSEMYLENSCIYLIDILEGASKKFKPLTEEETKKYHSKYSEKRKTKAKEDLAHALACYIGYGSNRMPDVFKFDDEEKTNKKNVKKLRDELRNLRNDYSHFTFSRKCKYTGEQYADLNFRLEVLIRLIFMNEYFVRVDDDLFNEIMSSIQYLKANAISVLYLFDDSKK